MRFVAWVFCWVWLGLPAQAAIGGVGSPVKISNLPAEKVKPAAEEEEKAAPEKEIAAGKEEASEPGERKPLLSIRYNQKHVYYQRALRQAVQNAERTKAGVTYEVISYIPSHSNRRKIERINQDADLNLRGVLGELRALGVPNSRVFYSTEALQMGASQEIRIFVK